MDKLKAPVSSSITGAATGERLYWCSKCHKLTEAKKGRCLVCDEGVTGVGGRQFEPSVFPSFSTDPMEIVDTDYELILIVPGKGKSLQFHFSLRRHYFPYLEAEGTQGNNSVISSAVSLEELKADMHHLGKCLPDLDWDKTPEKGASLLMKVNSGRVYKFNSLQNIAKHCFVVDGPGVLSNLTGPPFGLLGSLREYLGERTKGARNDVRSNYARCRSDMSHDQIVALVKAASGNEREAMTLIGELGKEFSPGKKQVSDKDIFKLSMGGQNFGFDDADEESGNNNSKSPRSRSSSLSDSDGYFSD